MEVTDEIDRYNIQDSIIENIRALKNKIKKRKYHQYFYEILGRAVFLGSVKSKKQKEEAYKSGYRTNQILEILTISKTLKDIINCLNGDMRLPNAPKILEQRINEEGLGVSNNGWEDRIYYLISKRLKVHEGDLGSLYIEIGRSLEKNLLNNREYREEYRRFIEDYERKKGDVKERRHMCALQLENQERLIRNSLRN